MESSDSGDDSKKPDQRKGIFDKDVTKFITKHALEQKEILRLQIERALNFHKALVQATPRVWVTSSLIIINVFVFIGMIVNGVSLIDPSKEQLSAWGAYIKPNVTIEQWWRLITCAFVHTGIIHLMLNVWCLWDVGRIVERLFGNVIFFIIYILCALGGSLASVILSPTVFSAGASGAIFGLFGALGSYALCHKKIIPGRIYRKLIISTIAFVAYNLVYGFVTQSVNNASNIGGLVIGFVLGALFSKPLHERLGLKSLTQLKK